MRRLRGKLRDSNCTTKLRTELRELRSRAITMISDSGNSDTMRALASSAALRLRAGRTRRAPRLAKTRAVSAPIPDVAPVEPHDQASNVENTEVSPSTTCVWTKLSINIVSLFYKINLHVQI